MRDQIRYKNTKYVIGCYSRGRIFMEHTSMDDAQYLMDTYTCLVQYDYCIYTCEEWNSQWPRHEKRSLWPRRWADLGQRPLLSQDNQGTK